MKHSLPHHSGRGIIEPLEQRIAPALIESGFVSTVAGSAQLLHAGEGLATSDVGGSYLVYVNEGQALVFTTDLNNNQQIDYGEVTGISAGDGLDIILMVDLHGDIVGNLNADGTLTDSDNDATNGRDGLVLLDSDIKKITLRSVRADDLANPLDVERRLALTSYSIFGNIYTGGDFGGKNGGLIIDPTGTPLLTDVFGGGVGVSRYVASQPQIGSIKVGTAASGESFSFGISSSLDEIKGVLNPFIPAIGSRGSDIKGISALDQVLDPNAPPPDPTLPPPDLTTPFSIGTLEAGDGAFNGRGGNIKFIQLFGDIGGYRLIAGDAGAGEVGPKGGSIINFSDQGSITSRILLQTGNGGEGILGKGGDGGKLVFVPGSPQNFAGHVEIVLGNGGDGYSEGGKGAGLLGADVVTPETEVPFALTLVSTTRHVGDIGNSRPIDFDRDGVSDFVFTTADTDQLVVAFGFGPNDFLPRTQFLDAPANATALVVADFNGDGYDDIASASGDSSFGGIAVYRNLGLSPSGEYQNFTDPLFSPLPALTAGSLFYQRAVPITDLAAADFNGDGVMDLAVTSIQEVIPPRSVVNVDVVIVMKGDTDAAGVGTGYFFGDFANAIDPSLVASPIITLGESGPEVITKPTALGTTNPLEAVLVSKEGDKSFRAIGLDANGDAFQRTQGLGKVDTNRKLVEGDNKNIALADATLLDFAILDVDQDALADVVVLTQAPEGFLVTFKGNGNPLLPIPPNPPPPLPPPPIPPLPFGVASNPLPESQNSGIKISGTKDDGGLGVTETENFVGILATNANDFPVTDTSDPDRPAINDIALINYDNDGNKSLGVLELTLLAAPQPPGPPPPPPGAPGFVVANVDQYIPVTRPRPGFDASIKAFDTYYQPVAPGDDLVAYAVAIPAPGRNVLTFGQAFAGSLLYDNALLITAGSGGDSVIGAGGAGGSLGTDLVSTITVDPVTNITTVNVVGSLNITLPVTRDYAATIRLTSGSGGDGFTDGGVAGDITGVTVQYKPAATVLSSFVLLSAGTGGDGFRGTGGDGGTLSQFVIESGAAFIGGAGGNGVKGGHGGAVLGAELDLPDNTLGGRIPNSEDSILVVQGGAGGDGLKRGGNGGKIDHFVSELLAIVGGTGGLVHYTAGDGGDGESGPGGKGGSIIDSSPLGQNNNLNGDLFLKAGAGGDGDVGGRGGSIVNFVNSPTTGGSPTSVSVLAGYGGSGINGPGGRGGSVRDINISGGGQGFGYVFDFSDPEDVFESLVFGLAFPTDLSFGRAIAGQGGNSFGGEGGDGGSLLNVTATATSRAMVAVAGRGGDGLTIGGDGGSVIDATLNSAEIDVPGNPTFGKVLVIAGDGGDAFASRGTGPNDPAAFGGVNGIGGQGGSIRNFEQPTSTETSVDLIAGNGGSTVNSGSSLSATTLVGKGGSIVNVDITGNIGNPDPLVPILAYDTKAGVDTMADFVANVLLGTPDAVLSDAFGNVGLVAGESGRVQDNDKNGELDPATAGVNGSAIDIKARNITSAVAGSVDRIASIQQIEGMRVSIVGGIRGADKDPVGSFDYLDANGNPVSTPQLGGSLIDGAIVAKSIIGMGTIPPISGPRVYIR